MKKLLVASSALVAAAGSAAALDVTLGGEISIESAIDLDTSGFNGAVWDTGLTLKAAGESMGWTYGGTLEIDMATANETTANGFSAMDLHVGAATIFMGGSFMGKIEVKDSCGNFADLSDSMGKVTDAVGSIGAHCVDWTGLDLAGVEVSAAFSLEKGVDTLILGASTDVSGVSVSAEYDVDSEDYDVIASMSVGGLDLGVDFAYDDAATDQYDYAVSVGTSVGDIGVTLEYTPELGTDGKDIMAEVTYGDCWTVDLGIDPTDDGATDENGIYMWSVGYECDLHDGVEVSAKLGDMGTAANADSLTGNIGATITF